MKSLPINCEANYFEEFLTPAEASALFDEIYHGYEITGKTVKMADGSEFAAENSTYLFVDPDLMSFDALPEVWGGRSPWPESLEKIRDRIKVVTGTRFRVARSVFYKDGSESMGAHRDLPAYGTTCQIASLSLGAEREFVFRPLDPADAPLSLMLKSGSLLFMGEHFQERYEHELPACEHVLEPRINLTFRRYGWD